MSMQQVEVEGNLPKESKPVMQGCEVLVRALEHEGVDTIFAYPGGASMQMHQALTRSKQIRTILPRHEQGGSFMAGGYARASGRPGVCMATSGPGATNLITGIADAWMDSVPLIAITGQVKREMIGKSAFQETDVFGMTLPAVKHSYLVMEVEDIPRIVKEAFHVATTGRPGPVLIDIPKDIQGAKVEVEFPETLELRGLIEPRLCEDSELEVVLDLIEKAERPVLYVGGGIISAEASADLTAFAKATKIPVTSTLMGVGAFPETDDLSLKWLGMHGSVFGNYAVDECDLLLAMGVRFDDRVTGNVKAFASGAKIVHFEVDESEIHKNKEVEFPILTDVKHALVRLNALVQARGGVQKTFERWHEKVKEWKREYPFSYKAEDEVIMPQQVMEELYDLTKGEAILTTGVGQHQMWAGQFYDFAHPRSFLSSAGLGSMGFGHPAAIGAKVACPEREVIDIDGDGSFLMNIQELATCVAEGIAAKVIVINNQHLGMVVQWEDRFFDGNRGHTFLGLPHDRDQVYPDYVKLCEGFGVPAERVSRPEDLRDALGRLISAEGCYVLDVMVPYTEHVLPMIPAGGTVKDIILDPMQEIEENGEIPG